MKTATRRFTGISSPLSDDSNSKKVNQVCLEHNWLRTHPPPPPIPTHPAFPPPPPPPPPPHPFTLILILPSSSSSSCVGRFPELGRTRTRSPAPTSGQPPENRRDHWTQQKFSPISRNIGHVQGRSSPTPPPPLPPLSPPPHGTPDTGDCVHPSDTDDSVQMQKAEVQH